MLISRFDNWLGKSIAAFAVVLMTLLVVQSPIASLDRLLHATGQGHMANAFAGALLEQADQIDDHDHDAAPSAELADGGSQVIDDGGPGDPHAPGSTHHHHQDNGSLYSLTADAGLHLAWPSSPPVFGLEDDLRLGIGAPQEERPPKAPLAHVA